MFSAIFNHVGEAIEIALEQERILRRAAQKIAANAWMITTMVGAGLKCECVLFATGNYVMTEPPFY